MQYRNEIAPALPPVKDPAAICRLAALKRFRRQENSVLCRLASKISGCAVGDRWRAIDVLRHYLIPLPLPPVSNATEQNQRRRLV